MLYETFAALPKLSKQAIPGIQPLHPINRIQRILHTRKPPAVSSSNTCKASTYFEIIKKKYECNSDVSMALRTATCLNYDTFN
jgi:hypothetical protein